MNNDITIPPEALEAAARAIAKRHGCGMAVFHACISAEEKGLSCRCEADARAACEAMLRSWPGMTHGTRVVWLAREGRHEVDSLILPLPQEKDE